MASGVTGPPAACDAAPVSTGHDRNMTGNPGPTARSGGPADEEVFRFIRDQIDSVPHLEALLLVWNSRPKVWSADDVADWLYVGSDLVRSILQDLARGHLIAVAGAGAQERFYYGSKSEDKDALIEAVAAAYRRELVRVSTFIHAKPPSALREFARAFRFTKERE